VEARWSWLECFPVIPRTDIFEKGIDGRAGCVGHAGLNAMVGQYTGDSDAGG